MPTKPHTTNSPMRAARREVKRRIIYTTGHIAKLCQVAPRTVAKWVDSGKLRGYRIPGSQDRRIPHDQLLRFLRQNGMPVPPEFDECYSLLIVSNNIDVAHQDGWPRLLPAGWQIKLVSDPFTAGVEVSGRYPAAVLADLASGIECRTLLRHCSAMSERPLLLVLVPEDQSVLTNELVQTGQADAAWVWPCDLAVVARQISATFPPEN